MSDRPSSGFDVHQEEDVVPAGTIAFAGIVSSLVAVLAVIAAGAILFLNEGTLRPTEAGRDGPPPPSRTISGVEQTPILDTKVGIDLRVRQQAELQQWGWADRDAGIATIPLDLAMEIMSAEAP
jgi:hypothetical protein